MKGVECACFGAIGSDSIELKMSKANKPWTSFNLAVDTGDEKTPGFAWAVSARLPSGSLRALRKTTEPISRLIRLDHWTDKQSDQKHGLSVSAFKVEKVGASNIGRNKPKRTADHPSITITGDTTRKGDVEPFNDGLPF
jgi:hypothetical protein